MQYSKLFILPIVAAAFPLTVQAQEFHGADQPMAATEPATPMTNEDMMTGWSAEQRAQFGQWPQAVQDYYATLPANRQAMFWTLADTDKVALAAMPQADQEAAWMAAENAVATPAPLQEPVEPLAEPQPEAEPMDDQPR